MRKIKESHLVKSSQGNKYLKKLNKFSKIQKKKKFQNFRDFFGHAVIFVSLSDVTNCPSDPIKIMGTNDVHFEDRQF